MRSLHSLAGIPLLCVWVFCVLTTSAQAGPDPRWLNPNGSNPDFTESYINGHSITFKWKKLNESDIKSDLWITSWDLDSPNVFTHLVKANRNISARHNYAWKLDIPDDVLDTNNQFVLRFLQNELEYSSSQFPQLASPGFKINKPAVNSGTVGTSIATSDATSPTGTPDSPSPTSTDPASTISSSPTSSDALTDGASSTTDAATLPTTTTPSSPDNEDSSLSAGAIAGISIGAACAIAALLFLGWLFGRRQHRDSYHNMPDEKNRSPPSLPPGGGSGTLASQPSYHKPPHTDPVVPRAMDAIPMHRYPREAPGSSHQPVELPARTSRHADSTELDSNTSSVRSPVSTVPPPSRHISSALSPVSDQGPRL